MKNGLLHCPVLLVFVFFAACSVKEDRTLCPSEFDVFFSAPSALAGKDLSFGVWGRESVLHDSFIYGGDIQGRTYYLPRTPLMIVSGNCPLDSSASYLIAKGSQCDSLYSVSNMVVPEGEFCTDTLYLRKDFATVTLSVNTEDKEDMENLKFRVLSNTRGMSLLDSKPLEGEFEYYIHFDPEMKSSFRLPRQLDDSFSMEVLDRSMKKVLMKVDFGEEIAASGYSWTDRDLKDIEIGMNLNFADASVSVMPWDDAGFIDIKF